MAPPDRHISALFSARVDVSTKASAKNTPPTPAQQVGDGRMSHAIMFLLTTPPTPPLARGGKRVGPPHPFPPLAKGGLGGVVPASPRTQKGAGSGGWSARMQRF